MKSFKILSFEIFLIFIAQTGRSSSIRRFYEDLSNAQLGGLENIHRLKRGDVENNEILKETELSESFFEKQLNETLQCFKKVVQLPNPSSGIVYDPWTKNETFKANIDNPILWTRDLYASNVAFIGLSNFDVLSLTLDDSMVQETVVRFNKLVLSGDYDDDMNWLGMLNAAGRGTFKFTWYNVELKIRVTYNNLAPLVKSVSVTGVKPGRVLLILTGVYNDEDFSIYFSALITTLTQKTIDEYLQEVVKPFEGHVHRFLSERLGELSYLEFLDNLATFKCSVK